ncbi:MAG: helix-turn-helix domain-containing protein [Rhodospirillales bacterium]|nr:helix-turn-helix domain-containing protein [Rhodospirillales bacterium]
MPDQADWRAIEREAGPGQAVGRLLRDQREARGLDLTQVEKSLRIRRSHLEAIEEGRYDKLPGAAYIPAFLRAYAAHVGLDAEKVMTAYHLSGAVPIKRPVTLPADFPVMERRAPIGLAVLTVLLVVGAGYGVWHFMPREQAVVAQKVPPVPDRLLSERPGAAPSASPAPDAARTITGSLPAQVWPAQRLDGGAPAAPLAPPPVVVAVPAPPPPAVMNVPSIGQAQAAQPPAPIDPPRIDPPRAPAEEATARQPEPTPAMQPPVPVRFNTPISVKINSWIELRAPNGDVLTQTYVRAGESYVVPAGIAYRITAAP